MPPLKKKERPLERTLKHYRKAGWTVGITEHFNPHVKIRQDLFGFIDAIAIRRDQTGALALQATGEKDIAEHIRKILQEPRAWIWLKAGNRIVVAAWGRRPEGWQVQEREITAEEIEEAIRTNPELYRKPEKTADLALADFP